MTAPPNLLLAGIEDAIGTRATCTRRVRATFYTSHNPSVPSGSLAQLGPFNAADQGWSSKPTISELTGAGMLLGAFLTTERFSGNRSCSSCPVPPRTVRAWPRRTSQPEPGRSGDGRRCRCWSAGWRVG